MRSLIELKVIDWERKDARDLCSFLAEIHFRPGEKGPDFVSRAGLKRGSVAWGGSASLVWREIIEQAVTGGKLPRLLEEILRDDPMLQTRVDEILASVPSGEIGDVLQAHFLGDDLRRAFVDRRRLRELLRELELSSASRVLVVSGPSESGKSYSWELISRFGADHQLNIRRLNFDQWTTSAPTPAEVARVIAQLMQLDAPEVDANAPDATQERLLRAWFVGQVAPVAHPPWLVVDSIDRPEVPVACRDLIRHIAEAADSGECSELRVILLGDPGLVSTNVWNAEHEELQPIDKVALRTFFEDVAATRGDLLETEVISSAVESVITNHDVTKPLARRVEEAARALFES